MVLLAASALVAGGLVSVAPLEVTTSAAGVLVLAPLHRRRRVLATLVVAVAMSVGALRARASIARHETQRAATDVAVPQIARCSARAQVDTSPVSVRGTLRDVYKRQTIESPSAIAFVSVERAALCNARPRLSNTGRRARSRSSRPLRLASSSSRLVRLRKLSKSAAVRIQASFRRAASACA